VRDPVGILANENPFDPTFCREPAAAVSNGYALLAQVSNELFQVRLTGEIPTGSDEIIIATLDQLDALLVFVHAQADGSFPVALTNRCANDVDGEMFPLCQIIDAENDIA